MLDLPAARHLLDDQFGVHPDLDIGVWRDPHRCLKTSDQPGILGDVVAGPSERLGPLDQHHTRRCITHERTEPGDARVAA